MPTFLFAEQTNVTLSRVGGNSINAPLWAISNLATKGFAEITIGDGDTPSVTVSNSGVYDGTYTTLADGVSAIQSITWMRANGPQCLKKPTITGTLGNGNMLTCDYGLWIFASDDAGAADLAAPAYHLQWANNAGDLAGQNATTCFVPAGSTSMAVTVTVTQPGVGQATQASDTLT